MSGPRRWLTLDGSARRLDGGRVLLGGSPLRLFRLTEAGARLVDQIEAGEAVASNPLVDRLLESGVVHPAVLSHRIFDDSAGLSHRIFDDSAGEGPTSSQVSVVMPVFGTGEGLGERIRRLGDVAEVVVVDDHSPVPLAAPEGARLIRHEANRGPGPARQTGLGAISTPLVAFVDDDVELPDSWLAPLLAHLADPAVVAVAPRIAGAPGPGRLARYDAAHGALDLGTAPAPVRARSRVAYVPTAVLVARAEAVRAVGGFDPALRTGEDVDLIWRLTEAGGRIRYEPAVVVHHRPRETLSAWLHQRAGYGRSAAPLARRHPGALTPVAVSSWSAAAWAIGALGAPAAGVAVALGSALALPRKLRGSLRHPVAESLRLAGRGHLFAGRQLANAVTRTWWPLAIVAAVTSRRARRAVAMAALLPPFLDWLKQRPPLDPASYVGLRLLDDLAYGAGVWRGMLAERTVAPIVPDLTSWPGRGTYETRASRPPAAATGRTAPTAAADDS